MAGVLSGTTSKAYFGNSHYWLYLTWSATQSISGNYSTVTANLYFGSDSGWDINASAKNASIVIDGSTYSFTHSPTEGGGTTILLGTYTHQVNHASDGTKTFTVSGTYDLSAITITSNLGSRTTSGSFTLTTIPRASTAPAPNWTAGTQNLSVSLTTYSSSFHHTLTLQVETPANAWSTVATRTNVGSSTTFTFTQAENTSIYTAIGQYESRPARVLVDTWDSSNNRIGSQTISSSGTVTGVAIAKMSAPSSANIGSTISATIGPCYTGFTYTAIFTIGSFSKTFPITNPSTSGANVTLSMTFTTAETQSIYSAVPNAKSGTANVEITSQYNGVDVNDGTPSAYNPNWSVTMNVTGSNPTFGTGYTYTDTNGVTTAITNDASYIIQNQSTVQVTLPTTAFATPVNGASMTGGSSGYAFTLNGVTKTATQGSSNIVLSFGTVNASTNQTLTVTATDSRGFQTTTSITVKMLPYSAPVVTGSAKRLNGFENEIDLTLTGSISPLTTTAQKNQLTAISGEPSPLEYCYAENVSGSTYSAWTAFTYTTSGATYTATAVSVSLDNTKSYIFQIRATDKLQTSTKTYTVASGQPVMFIDFDLNSVGVGKFPEVAGRLESKGAINSYDSVGVVNPNTPFTTGATLGLSFLNDQARIRYGGNGAGNNSGLQIQGTGDVVKWAVTDTGDVNNYGVLYLQNGKNLVLKAVSGGNDPGDILFENGDATEKIRIYTGASSNELYIRQSGSRSILSFDLNGDASFGATADPSVVNIPNGSLYIANSTGSTVLRLVTDSSTVYVQGGKDLNDTTSKMVLARTGTTSANLHQMYIYADQLWFPQQFSTLSALTSANMAINTGGLVNKMGSSKDYKVDIQDLWESQAEKVLQLRPVMYKANTDITIDRPDWSTVGLIAEEVAEIDPRLVQYDFAYDKENNPDYLPPTSELKPIGVNYDKLAIYLIPIVRQLKAKVDYLEEKLKNR